MKPALTGGLFRIRSTTAFTTRPRRRVRGRRSLYAQPGVVERRELNPESDGTPNHTEMLVARKPWQRSGPDRRIRGGKGQRMRERRLARTDGLCEMCDAEGLTTLATVVNHKVPLAHGGLDVDENTENLCARHDAIVTARQFGKAEPIKAKGVGRDGRPTSRDHPWNRGS